MLGSDVNFTIIAPFLNVVQKYPYSQERTEKFHA